MRNFILASTNYEIEIVRELLNTVISQRTEEAEQRKRELESEERRKREEREFELEKLKVQNDSLNSAESQTQAADVPKEVWASHLLILLPYEIAQLVAKEDVGASRDFQKVKCLLLKRYKLSAEKFRQLFSNHCKSQLKELIIVDKIKRRVPPEVREHFIVEWSQHNYVEKLASKLDDYDAVPAKRYLHTSNPEEELNTQHTLLLSRRGNHNKIRNSQRNLSLREKKIDQLYMLWLWKSTIHKSQVSFVYTQREVQFR
ncbi:hypothetical protein AVEN_133287-1 [Araneus ventricosus]|uniref:Uncharacterized protein n=1 Tax=Araneus ventricosus TaxID=182803 RepID=A0A4Y2DJP0_ARAVE|nr:hypothetical protein AVEN_133287-1 [Araneus ventricosus]